ncbi:superoxide dismutase [Flavobacterium sp. KMS]|uniref:superoxide dismutase n=1 Tax=Flavobacterium sp. KMS TaxID=1566023 RepID=UPI00057FDDB9|nr:superoxide dismutase [Flavobacterium sp. KMS]KIA98387.1 superoxide dismutase [Flavobacterium sp. KMS]
MKKYSIQFSFFILISLTILSCNDNNKLTEVVEVPLPSKDEKIIIGSPDEVKANPGAFLLEKLPYAYNALAPNIRSLTLETHYSKHYLTYTNNLNKAIANTDYVNMTIEQILGKLDLNDANLRNNAGGYYNHSLYWKCMTPKPEAEQATDTLAGAMNKEFGSYNNFKNLFKAEATKQFGSGWVWLVVDKAGKLQITTTQNQDNPLMKNALISGTPILALDLWEHAYYLDYQNRKNSYVDAFFNIINWEKINENYKTALTKVRKV